MQKQLIPVRFLGLDEREAKGFRLPGTLEVVENYYYAKGSDGGVELVKRVGATTLSRSMASGSGGGTITAGKRLEVVGDALWQLATLSNRRYDVICGLNTQAGQWTTARRVTPFAFSTTPISVDSSTVSGGYVYSDGAVGGGYALFAYANTAMTNVLYRVIDLSTGKQVDIETAGPSTGSLVRAVRVVYSGSVFLVFYVDAANNFKCFSIPPSNPLNSSAATTISAVVAGSNYDVVKVASDTLLLAYRPAAGNVTISKWSSAMTAGTSPSPTTTAIAANQALAWPERENYNDGNAYLYVADSVSGTRMYSMTLAALTPALHSTVDAALVSVTHLAGYHNVTAGEFGLYASVNTALAQDATTKNYINTGGGWFLNASTYGLTIAARPCLIGGAWYWLAAYETNSTATTTQNTYILLRAHDSIDGGYSDLFMGSHLPGEGGGHLRSDTPVPGSWAIDATNVMFPTRRRARLVSNGSAAQYASRGPQMLIVDSSPSGMSQAARLAWTSIMPGAMARSVGTNDAAALGFIIGPEKPTLVQAAGGNLTANGTYSFVVGIERFSPQGERTYSVISEPASITLTGTNKTVQVSYQNLTVEPGFVEGAAARIRIFRTLSGQTQYYRSTSSDSYANSVSLGVSSVNDDQADTVIVNNEPIYTDSGELDSQSPPPSRVACVWKNRVWLAGCERDDEIWPSKELVRDVAPAFSGDLVVRVERDGGAVTALVPLEDRLLVLKRAGAYVITGDGPADDGTGQPFLVTKLPVQVGTIYPRSCVYFSDGVIFKSQQGFFLLTRGLEPQYIGAAVEDYNSLDCTGAVVEEDKGHIRFFSTNGRELVYNWLFKKWSTYTGHPAVAACKWMNKVTWLASDGTVWQDAAGVYQDNGVNYTTTATMNFASFAGIEGYQRVSKAMIFGETLGAMAINVAYTTNHGNTDNVTENFTSVTNPGRALEIQPRVRRTTSVRLSITETSSTAGFALRGVTFLVGVLPGTDRVPTLARKGPN